jgi:hypothetical protein
MKKRQAKEKAAALALLEARNIFQTTTAAAATNTATAGGPTPANATAKRRSPNRLCLYHVRADTRNWSFGRNTTLSACWWSTNPEVTIPTGVP